MKRLAWSDEAIQVSLLSAKSQSVLLHTPGEIARISAPQSDELVEDMGSKNARRITLPAGREITLNIVLQPAAE